MIETKDSNRSLIIPKWHSVRTSRIEEFTYGKRKEHIDPSRVIRDLENDYSEFLTGPDIMSAIDLLNASIVLNNNDIYNDVAKYIINCGIASATLNSLAKSAFKANKNVYAEFLNKEIEKCKIMLVEFPRDPLLWSELARLYTIKGQWWKAKKAIIIAYNLAPGNRFIARAVSRFYLHINEPDTAVKVLRRSYGLNADPMVLATLTNCCLIAEKPIKNFYKPSLDLPEKDVYQNSELLATTGVLEMFSGNDRQAKKYFRKGWLNPTENVIAHAYWVHRNQYAGLQLVGCLDYKRSAEASTWRKFYELDIQGAIEMSVKWGLEEPYSTHPFTCGSSIASIAGNDHVAVDIARKGLMSNPHDMALRNNLAFALLKLDKLNEADELLELLPSGIGDLNSAVIEATRGYRLLKHGELDKGRNSYLNAINKFIECQQGRIAAEAMLYHAMAEKEMKTTEMKVIAEKAIKYAMTYKDYPSIKLLCNKIQQSRGNL